MNNYTGIMRISTTDNDILPKLYTEKTTDC